MPNINSIKFDVSKGRLSSYDSEIGKEWVFKNPNIIIGLSLSDKPNSYLPSNLTEIDTVRNHFRKSEGKGIKQGLIKCDVIKIKGFQIIELIVKQHKYSKNHFNYGSGFLIPFKDYCFSIRLMASSGKMEKPREETILERGKKENDNSEILNKWEQDPYNENYQRGILMNYAEREIFDKEFPNHCLSILRNKMEEIKSSLIFDRELERLERY